MASLNNDNDNMDIEINNTICYNLKNNPKQISILRHLI